MKFIEHFVLIVDAMRSQGLWDDDDGFFYDVLPRPDGAGRRPIKVRSIVGVLPLLAHRRARARRCSAGAGALHQRFARFLERLDRGATAQRPRQLAVPGRRARS